VPTSELRQRGAPIKVLTAAEIDKMRTVCRLGREVLNAGAAAIRPGVTTDEIDRVVHEATIARGAYPSPLNYNGFPKSCCTCVGPHVDTPTQWDSFLSTITWTPVRPHPH
jgi:methionyl aminopeptidase